jgi:hypothetical protein
VGIIPDNLATTTVVNSTLSRNSAPHSGGGIYNVGGTVNLTNGTLSENSAAIFGGGGIFNSGVPGSTVSFTNSIIANSISDSPLEADCRNSGTVDDLGFNLVEDGSCIYDATSLSGDPRLGPLQDNGVPPRPMPCDAAWSSMRATTAPPRRQTSAGFRAPRVSPVTSELTSTNSDAVPHLDAY